MKKILAISFVLVLMISGCIGSPTVDVQADVQTDVDIHYKSDAPTTQPSE